VCKGLGSQSSEQNFAGCWSPPSKLGLYRIAEFTIRPNKNNSFYYSAEYE